MPRALLTKGRQKLFKYIKLGVYYIYTIIRYSSGGALKWYFAPGASYARYAIDRGAEAQACDCERDSLWVRFPLEKMKY